MARFERCERRSTDAENKALYETVRAGRPKLVGPFSVLMHNPPLARAVNQVVDAIRARRQARQAALRAGRADHGAARRRRLRLGGARSARAQGRAVGRRGRGDPGEAKPNFAKADEKAIYDAVTELLNTNRIGDAAYQELIKQFGLETTIEIVTCVGLYCMIGGVINAFEVPTANGEKPF